MTLCVIRNSDICIRQVIYPFGRDILRPGGMGRISIIKAFGAF